MKELSLNILDIAMNSVKAKAKNIEILLNEDKNGILTLKIKDDGTGMTKEMLNSVSDPFFTTRTTRKVGMGIPLLKLASEQAGGTVTISSVSEKDDSENHGTVVSATFDTNNIDFTPLGDIASTVCVLLQGNPDIDFLFVHETPCKSVKLYTKELREVLGEVPLNSPEVLNWVKEFLNEQYNT